GPTFPSYRRHPRSGRLLSRLSDLSTRPGFDAFGLKPCKHVLREVPLRLPAQIKLRHSKPHNLAGLDLEPVSHFPQVKDFLRILCLHVYLHEWCDGKPFLRGGKFARETAAKLTRPHRSLVTRRES